MKDDASSAEGALALKNRLRRSWHVFLARFQAPTPIQLAGIPSILDGVPTLLVAPTASGKTEAYAAPIAEQITPGEGPPEAWIVCPTRALVNDLYRRLQPLFEKMGLSMRRRTGDHREIDSKNPPRIGVTTPESLDSMLARMPALFSAARYLVLDEIHLLDESARGDQLACLVSRIQRISARAVAVASSATVDAPESLALRYLGEPHRVVTAEGTRPICADFVDSGPAALFRALTDRSEGPLCARKVLAFARRRAEAERLSAFFGHRPPFGDAVFAHHGSLSRHRREAVERRMLRGTAGLCFATSTLEVGIDIGDIDLVVLTAPPSSVASLLQRIGRGNRRTGVTHLLGQVAGPGQRARFEHMVCAAREGRLLADPRPFDPSVIVQQCFGLLMQSPGGWISPDILAARLPGELAGSPWPARLPELLDHLCEEAWLTRRSGRYFADDRLTEAFEKGTLHSNISDRGGKVELIDRETRRILGTVPSFAASEGNKLLFHGRKLRALKTGDPKKRIVVDTHGRADLSMPAAPAPLVSFRLARDLARHLGVPESSAPIIETDNGTVIYFHFLGTIWSALLREILSALGMPSAATTPFCTALASDSPLPEISEPIVHRIIEKKPGALARKIQTGPWYRHLPRAWQIDDLRIRLRPKRFVGIVSNLRPTIGRTLPPAQRDLLVSLAFDR